MGILRVGQRFYRRGVRSGELRLLATCGVEIGFHIMKTISPPPLQLFAAYICSGTPSHRDTSAS